VSAEDQSPAVVLDVPAVPSSLRILRLAAADSAADAGLDLDGIESARIAVDELASLVLAIDGGDRLVVRFRRSPGRLEVRGTRASEAAEPPVVDPIARELLSVCVSDWQVDRAPDELVFRFEQRASITSGP
jgi:hypothetical protein